MAYSRQSIASCWYSALATISIILPSPSWLNAAVLYEQDFEGETIESTGIGFNIANSEADLFQLEIAPSGGAAGTSGLINYFDSARVPQAFEMNFYKEVGAITDAATSRLRFSVDIKTVGNLTATPVDLYVYQIDQIYEARRGIDANNDGDMTDSAHNFRSKFSPILINGDGFVTASFIVDQGAQDAYVYPPQTPIPPMLDATLPLRWGIAMGSDGFGFDAGNSVAFDNIKIELIPEPTTLALALMASASIAVRWRRLKLSK